MKRKVRASAWMMISGFAALAISIASWVFYPFFDFPNFNWGKDIGNEEKTAIMAAIGEISSDWNKPPPLDGKTLLERVSGRMKTNRSIRIDKTADGYRVTMLYERGGHEVEEMWLTYDSDYAPASVGACFE